MGSKNFCGFRLENCSSVGHLSSFAIRSTLNAFTRMVTVCCHCLEAVSVLGLILPGFHLRGDRSTWVTKVDRIILNDCLKLTEEWRAYSPFEFFFACAFFLSIATSWRL
jgi:hypothetical protein